MLSRYILSIEKAEEIEEYVGDLLQGTDGRKRHFIDELLRRWKKTQTQATDTTNLFLLTETVSLTGMKCVFVRIHSSQQIKNMQWS